MSSPVELAGVSDKLEVQPLASCETNTATIVMDKEFSTTPLSNEKKIEECQSSSSSQSYDGDDSDSYNGDLFDDSEEESEVENEDSNGFATVELGALQRKLHRENSTELNLPKTVSLINGPKGEILYLVGTAHFSKESCEDVRKIISAVQPDAVVVELCQSRTQILTFDEEQLTLASNENSLTQMKKCINQKGVLSGLVLYMMLYMSAHITKQLGMAPGGEFRAAFSEAKKVPGCQLYLGDRRIEITLQRMLASLSLWQKMKFAFMLLQELKPISAEDIEKMKEEDMFEQILKEMVDEFPHMAKALVTERDMYITGFLQNVLKRPVFLPGMVSVPPVIVAVVGIGHCNGIKSHFDTEITANQLREISTIPPPSKTKKIVKTAFKGLFFIASLYAAYKVTNWMGVHSKLLHFVKV